jgi:hypothetical protein
MVTFTNLNDAARWGEEFFASILPSLTDEEISALQFYKHGGYAFLNRMLRDGEGKVIPFPLTDEWLTVYNLDSAISKSILPQVTLYRGQWLTPGKRRKFDAGVLVGEIIWNTGFCSTSLLFEEAEEYFLQHPEDSAILQTVTPLGMEGIYLDVKEIENLRQCEVLLPRGLDWRVLHAERDTENRRIVTAELVW